VCGPPLAPINRMSLLQNPHSKAQADSARFAKKLSQPPPLSSECGKLGTSGLNQGADSGGDGSQCCKTSGAPCEWCPADDKAEKNSVKSDAYSHMTGQARQRDIGNSLRSSSSDVDGVDAGGGLLSASCTRHHTAPLPRSRSIRSPTEELNSETAPLLKAGSSEQPRLLRQESAPGHCEDGPHSGTTGSKVPVPPGFPPLHRSRYHHCMPTHALIGVNHILGWWCFLGFCVCVCVCFFFVFFF
jgi:hypothetical protein